MNPGRPTDLGLPFSARRRRRATYTRPNEFRLRQARRCYTTAGRRLGATSRRTTSRRSTQQRTDNAAVRAWARENGHTVPDRGRIPHAVMAAYTAAH